MRTSVPLNLSVPVAVKNWLGEWVEVGYTTDLELTIETDEWMEAPFRPRREISLSMEVSGTETALTEILRVVRELTGTE